MPPASIDRESLETLQTAFNTAVARGDWMAAFGSAEAALSIVGDQPVVIGDLALCQMRLGRYEEALRNFRAATILAPDNFNLFDGLAEACGYVGDLTGVRAAGMTALTLRDKQRREGHAGYETEYFGPVAKQHLECDSQHVLRLDGRRIGTCDCSFLFRRVQPLITG